MGHNITNRDQQHGLKQAWHRLTRVKEKIDPNDNYLTSWDVERRTLSFEVDGEDVDSGFDILVGSDDEQLIGKPMSKAYKEISNESFMDLVSDAMNRLPKAKLESVGWLVTVVRFSQLSASVIIKITILVTVSFKTS